MLGFPEPGCDHGNVRWSVPDWLRPGVLMFRNIPGEVLDRMHELLRRDEEDRLERLRQLPPETGTPRSGWRSHAAPAGASSPPSRSCRKGHTCPRDFSCRRGSTT